jgi:four helix bundle protein
MQDYRHLKAWQLAELIAMRLLAYLDASQTYRAPGMRTQLLRAAHSVSSNIAEGCSRRSPAEFRRFLEVGLGSLLEVESSLDLALHAHVLHGSAHSDLVRKCAVLGRMLRALIARVDQSTPPRRPSRRRRIENPTTPRE